MHLLSLPANAFFWLDAALAHVLPHWVRLILWSALAATVSMLLYAWLSPQQRISAIRAQMKQTQQQLNEFDGEFDEAMPMIRHNLKLALQQLALITGPAVAALLPMVLVAAWMLPVFGYRMPPPQAPIKVKAEPAVASAQWQENAETRTPKVIVADQQGRKLGDFTVTQPAPVIPRLTVMAALAGSPLGFLPRDSAVNEVTLKLPEREYLPWGPSWMRGWTFVFFAVLSVVALGIKRALRLH